MTERRRGLGRGLGALIPTAPTGATRPIDLFFADAAAGTVVEQPPAERSAPPSEAAERNDEDGAPAQARLAPSAPVSPAPAPAAAQRPAPVQEPRPVDHQAPAVPAPAQQEERDRARAAWAEAAARDESSLVPVPGAHFAEVPVDQVGPNPRQPRQVFDEEAQEELVHSVREIGVLQPVVVRPVGTDAGGDRYELVMGERRWRAAQAAGLDTIPAIVRETSDDDLLRDALLENLHRSQLNPLEEAAAYQQLLDDFGCTHDHLAQRIGRSRPQISNTIRLLRLPPLVQRRVAAGVLSAGHARALLGLGDGAAMERLAQRIVAEGLSVRATEEIVALGGEGDGAPRSRTARRAVQSRGLDDLAARLSDRFDTRVSIAMGQRKGKLTVEFASVDDLNRILSSLAPEEDEVSADDAARPVPEVPAGTPAGTPSSSPWRPLDRGTRF